MKKTVISFGVLLVIVACLLYSCDWDFVYEKRISYGNLYFSPHKFADVCRVDYGVWNSAETSFEFKIPDEVDGHRVTVWGNDYPAPFLLHIDRSVMSCGKELLPDDARIVPLHLTIHIGANLREIRAIEMKDLYQDCNDPQVYYQILVTIHCSTENPFFYSENGKLYQKNTGTMIEAFYYETDFR